jgi:hypothetical protein
LKFSPYFRTIARDKSYTKHRLILQRAQSIGVLLLRMLDLATQDIRISLQLAHVASHVMQQMDKRPQKVNKKGVMQDNITVMQQDARCIKMEIFTASLF